MTSIEVKARSLRPIDQGLSLVVQHCLLCIICQREQGEAVYFSQIRSLYLPEAPFRGSSVSRRGKGGPKRHSGRFARSLCSEPHRRNSWITSSASPGRLIG